jgi:hypothetical protein
LWLAGKRLIDVGVFEKLTTRRSLSSLNALRAFEAMARSGSATRAAAELNVTHSAVSRQVKALEASLGVRLFEGPRSVLRLTAAGRELLVGLTPGLVTINEAVRRVRVRSGVTIAIHNSLAVKWLIPRLGDFERRHPDLTLELSDLPVEAGGRETLTWSSACLTVRGYSIPTSIPWRRTASASSLLRGSRIGWRSYRDWWPPAMRADGRTGSRLRASRSPRTEPDRSPISIMSSTRRFPGSERRCCLGIS